MIYTADDYTLDMTYADEIFFQVLTSTDDYQSMMIVLRILIVIHFFVICIIKLVC